jgi:hypothetical protein
VPSWGGAGGGHGSGWGATSLPPEQASHPFAAEVHAVLATEPGPDLAIPFSGEGCGVQDLADQLDQVAIADRGGRTGPATGTGCGAAGRRGWSGARRAPGTPRPLVAGRPWLAGPLRRRELQPPLSVWRPPVNGDRLTWLVGCAFPGGGVAAAEPSPGPSVERPQQREDERPWCRRRFGACVAGQGRSTMISPGRSPPDRGGGERRVRAGAQPYLGARTQPGPATR